MTRRVDHARTVTPLAALAALVPLIFVVAPLPFIVLSAISHGSYRLLDRGSPTLEWFRAFLANDRFMAALRNSLSIAIITTVAVLLIALPTALAVVRGRLPGRGLLVGCVSMPLLVPGVIVGTAALSFVAQTGAGPGYWPITVAMIAAALPLALRPLVANLSGLDPDQEKAARNLGASPLRSFFLVTLPQLAPGLLAGGIFAFIEAMDNFSITAFLTNINTTTLPIEAYSYIRDIDDPTVAAMATLLVIMSLVLVAVIDRLLRLDRFLDLS
ncbi:MAG TPA: ABC transporter permease [Stellaceae bacterium]|nr:ABC transporter permease [Stellaceae bacterium]